MLQQQETLVEVPVSLGADVATPPVTVTVTVTSGGTVVASTSFPWSKAQNGTLYAGVFVPDSAAGQVTIAATGTDASGAAMTAIPQDENIVAGQTNGPYPLTLHPSAAIVESDAAVPDSAPSTGADVLAPESGDRRCCSGCARRWQR